MDVMDRKLLRKVRDCKSELQEWIRHQVPSGKEDGMYVYGIINILTFIYQS